MSNFNPLSNAKIPQHRSSFDMSSKRLFTSKAGMLIPVWWQHANPNDVFEISGDWFTRTIPVNTSAYTRIREYYDFFSVPLRLISRSLPQAFTQMTDYSTSASSSNANTPVYKNVPYMPLSQISSYVVSMGSVGVGDDVGYSQDSGALRLLNMLGYGPVLNSTVSNISTIFGHYSKISDIKGYQYRVNHSVNVLPLAAYQKIYFDFYSNNQWERHLAYAYNFDYWDGVSSLPSSGLSDLFKIRYVNWNKDWFFGMLPNSQYGDVAVLPSLYTTTQSSNRIVATPDDPPYSGHVNAVSVAANSSSLSVSPNSNVRGIYLNSDLSALSIRATEYLQRWKEIVQFGSKDYSDQIERQFGIKAPEYMGNHCHYIGGWSSDISINEVVNTNLESESSQASIAGKGVASGSGHKLTFKAGAEHCVIMCIYHAVPVCDWSSVGIDPKLTCTSITDFPQPAFDQLGMTPVPNTAMDNSQRWRTAATNEKPVNYGYNLRYWQFKSDNDYVRTGFFSNGSYRSWVAPIEFTLATRVDLYGYKSFKVNPSVLNNIFVAQADSTVDTDQFLNNINIRCYKVSNLDRDGLPF
nr:MAG: major capsid protein [Microvirus sp.]